MNLIYFSAFYGVFVLFFIAGQNLLPDKLKPLPIVNHLVTCMVIFPFILWLISYFTQIVPSEIIKDPSLQYVNKCISALVLLIILMEIMDFKFDKKSVPLSFFSFLIPFAVGFGCASYLRENFDFAFSSALGCIFAVSAIPVLYLYLRQMNIEKGLMYLLMFCAILIDVYVWLIFEFINQGFSFWKLIISLLVGFGLAFLSYIFNCKSIIVGFLFMSTFFLFYFLKQYYIIFTLSFIFVIKQLDIEVDSSFFSKHKDVFLNWIAVPFLFAFAMSNAKMNLLDNLDQRYVEYLMLIFLPIIAKWFASWLGFKFMKIELAGKLAWLLNTRGLTEIIFLNLLINAQMIDFEQYACLLLMSFISTIIPSFIKLSSNEADKKQKNML